MLKYRVELEMVCMTCCFLVAAGLRLEEVERLCAEVADLRERLAGSEGRERKSQALVQVICVQMLWLICFGLRECRPAGLLFAEWLI